MTQVASQPFAKPTGSTGAPLVLSVSVGIPTPAQAQSQSEARLQELYGALRKLNILTCVVTLLLLGTTGGSLPNLLRMARGERSTRSFCLSPPATSTPSPRPSSRW